MIAPTHIITGQTAYLVASVVSGHSPTLAEGLLAGVCGLLPDLDKRQGIIGRLFPMISEPLDYYIGHRTLTHSLLFLAGLAASLWYLLPFGVWLAVVAGTISHVFVDMMTPSGVELFWPSKVRAVLPGNVRYRFDPMGWPELGFAIVVGLVGLPLVHLAQAEHGTGGLIKSALGDIASARRDYDAQKGNNAWTLRIEGRDNRSYEDIAGEYSVIGPYGENGFILRTEYGPESLCEQQACGWYADRAVLVKGEEESTTTHMLNTHKVSRATLEKSFEEIRAYGEVFLLGTLTAPKVRERPPVVAVAGETVSLHYADPEVLQSWKPAVLRDVELSIQVRHRPSMIVPEVELQSDERLRLPDGLGRWLQ